MSLSLSIYIYICGHSTRQDPADKQHARQHTQTLLKPTGQQMCTTVVTPQYMP